VTDRRKSRNVRGCREEFDKRMRVLRMGAGGLHRIMKLDFRALHNTELDQTQRMRR
jgi:hypothetical protein